ncbi:NAD(P)-binding protein [Pseudovirgaria hyperparasitica]|uniref:NAD(P)-binding protein n=1 Tax=Pseudovirgaria hyperparasitica TaxID=470096 RepID=A0A6A6WL93_9PEZI|nr:NAD(P)-binding protein [Pseudovirgaria hyperparasitica]KAF2762942.1 NAD(P)-binding protein [Pseudovirgaria hyperparasitica]
MSQSPTMRAVQVTPAPPSAPPYSPSNPAPSSALTITTRTVPAPSPGTLLIRNHASTIIRDTLTWPELYVHPSQIPGNDFAGTVAALPPNSSSPFAVGTEVFGMTHADRGATWAEYVVVREDECAQKPASLSWAKAAAAPLSSLTAWQALFDKVRLDTPVLSPYDPGAAREKNGGQRVLVTGAAGGVGAIVVQLAVLAGYSVTGATSSNARNETFVRSLGADDVVEYAALRASGRVFDAVVDTVGGGVLEGCWSLISPTGSVITVDSASYAFPATHHEAGLSKGKEGVHAEFFIVEPSVRDLEWISEALDKGLLKVWVAETIPLEGVREAYETANGRLKERGKVVLTM